MYTWLFIATVLLTLVTGEDEYIFKKSPKELIKCIENHEDIQKNSYYRNTDLIQSLIYGVGMQFSRTSRHSAKKINSNIDSMIYSMKKEKHPRGLKNAEAFWSKLKIDLTTALIFCNDGSVKVPLTVPVYNGEQRNLAAVLDYMLVDWPDRLRDMLQTPNERVIVWQYVDQCLSILPRAINSMASIENFRTTIRTMFSWRALHNFDCLNSALPFITYIFVKDSLAPHVDAEALRTIISFNRRDRDFVERNPLVSHSNRRTILDIHSEDKDFRSNRDNNDIYGRYDRNGMRCSEYYLEVRINQFYRLIFLRMEMILRGIPPNGYIPESILAIVDNDVRYRDYLMETRRTIANHGDAKNALVQNLRRNSRVVEENLFLYLLQHMISRGLISNTTTTISSTTPSIKDTTDETNEESDFDDEYYLPPDDTYPDSGSGSSYESARSDTWDFSNFFPYQAIDECNQHPAGTNTTDNDYESEECSIIRDEQEEIDEYYGFANLEGYSNGKPISEEEVSAFEDAMKILMADLSLSQDFVDM